jgi:putative intracellular protease/amidase
MPYEHKIITLLYSDYEALDVFGPIGAIVPRSDFYKVEFVTLNSIQNEKGVESSIKNGIATPTSKTIDEVISSKEEFDTLFIPGGFGFLPLIWDPFLLKKIAILVDQAPNVFTVCTGSLLLAATGKLEGRKATTNKRLFDDQTPRRK